MYASKNSTKKIIKIHVFHSWVLITLSITSKIYNLPTLSTVKKVIKVGEAHILNARSPNNLIADNNPLQLLCDSLLFQMLKCTLDNCLERFRLSASFDILCVVLKQNL